MVSLVFTSKLMTFLGIFLKSDILVIVYRLLSPLASFPGDRLSSILVNSSAKNI